MCRARRRGDRRRRGRVLHQLRLHAPRRWTGSRCRAASPSATRSRRCSWPPAAPARAWCSPPPGEQCTYADMYEWQPRIGRPFTYPLFALAERPSPPAARAARGGRGARRAGLAAGHAAAAHDAVHDGQPVQPQREPGVRRRSWTATATRASPRTAIPTGAPGPPPTSSRQPMQPRWETCEVSESSGSPSSRAGGSTSSRASAACSPLDVICELALAEDLATRFRIYIANDDVGRGARTCSPTSTSRSGLSDAGAHVGQLCDAPLPTDLLGTWVRDAQVMPLERAVRKLTGEPADMFGFVDRGYLREGVLGRRVRVRSGRRSAPGPSRRVRDFPADGERLTAEEPTGVRHVLVNGTPIRRDEVQLDSPDCVPACGPRSPDPADRRGSAHGAEEGPQVVDEQLGLLHGGEVAAARHDRPVRHVVALLDPRPREAQDLLLRVARDAGGNASRTPAAPSARRCAWSPSTAGPTT